MTSNNDELIHFRLRRSGETLEEARIMAETSHWNGCVNRLYYASFYAISALLLTKDLSSSKHSGVRGLFSLHFVKTGIVPKELAAIYNYLFDSRQECDYEDFFNIDPDEAAPLIEQTEQLIEFVTNLLTKKRQHT